MFRHWIYFLIPPYVSQLSLLSPFTLNCLRLGKGVEEFVKKVMKFLSGGSPKKSCLVSVEALSMFFRFGFESLAFIHLPLEK